MSEKYVSYQSYDVTNLNLQSYSINRNLYKNCSLILVMLSNSLKPSEFPNFRTSLCNITESFLYIRDGAGKNVSQKIMETDNSIIGPKIVRVSEMDHGNLFGLALSIYFTSKYVAIIDVDRLINDNSIPSTSWIDLYLDNLIINGYDIIFSNSRNPTAFLSHQKIIRHFLLYTNIKYSDTSAMSILYNYIDCKNHYKFGVLKSNLNEEKVCDNIPNEWKCEENKIQNVSSYAILIPTFKRNYMKRSIEALEMQTIKPSSIYIVQNKMFTHFDFFLLESYTKIPIKHMWCTNWNSYFYLTYCVMMFIEDLYYMKIDDDFFFETSDSAENMCKYESQHPNTMIGVGNTFNHINYCECKPYKRKYVEEPFVDYISWLVLMYSSAGKILHRFAVVDYIGAEDVAVGLANNIECNTKSASIKGVKGENVGIRDGMTHTRDEEIKNNYRLVPNIWEKTVCHFIIYGYNPIAFESYQCANGHKNIEEIRHPH